MLSEAGVTSNPGRHDAVAGRRPPWQVSALGRTDWDNDAFCHWPICWPFTVSVTSMLPRVALEYGHTWCAAATSRAACSGS